MRLLRKCSCRYTIDQDQDTCQLCQKPFRVAYPPKFSLHDKYADYRRRMKELARERGVLE
jgi:rRNA maturation protein Nop10